LRREQVFCLTEVDEVDHPAVSHSCQPQPSQLTPVPPRRTGGAKASLLRGRPLILVHLFGAEAPAERSSSSSSIALRSSSPARVRA
jgi:hypothetical protein